MGWLSKLFNLDSTLTGEEESIESHASNTPSYGRRNHSGSGSDARNRLKLVLMHDRTKLSSETIEKMRDELVAVISKYVEIDKEALELKLESESDTMALVANIPVLRARQEEETENTEEKNSTEEQVSELATSGA